MIVRMRELKPNPSRLSEMPKKGGMSHMTICDFPEERAVRMIRKQNCGWH